MSRPLHATRPSREALRGFAERTARAVERLLPAISPVFIPSQKGDADLVGSGVLLRIGPSELLVTAAHVMDIAKGDLHIGGESQIVDISGEYSETGDPATRDSDKFDLAILPLSQAHVSQLRDARFLSLDDLEPFETVDHRPVIGSKYLLLGFPATKQSVTRDGNVRVDPLRFVAQARPTTEYEIHGRDPSHHLLLEYNKKRGRAITGQVTLPDPYGVSGGGVFRVRGWAGEEAERETLVAIPTHYTGRVGKSVICTRIAEVLRGVMKRYPHLVSHIRRAFG